jgi:hypothetical protein
MVNLNLYEYVSLSKSRLTPRGTLHNVGDEIKEPKGNLTVGGKMNLPPHGKEIFTDAVSRILHERVRSFLHGTVRRILQNTISPACGE